MAAKTRVLLNNRFVFKIKRPPDNLVVYLFDKKRHAKALLHNLIVIQDNADGSLSDVVIISKENEKFYFHAPILAALSKKLEENLLKQDLGSANSKKSQTVIKEKFSSEAIQCLWDYAYTSVVTLTPSNVHEVKELAELHGLYDLKKKCEVTVEEERFGKGSEKVKVEFDNLPENILNRLHDLREQNKQCSTVFKDFGDSKMTEVSCHGALIAAACTEFFSELVYGDTNILEMNCRTIQAMDIFMQYLYTAKLMIDRATVLPLLQFAVDFNVPSVSNACCCWLRHALTNDNALGTMGIAQACQVKVNEPDLETETKDGVTLSSTLNDLYQYARSFVLRNFLSVQQSIEYLVISLEELIDLLIDDDLTVNSEENVFYAVMKWVEFSPETRAVELPNLLEAVRLEYISSEFLDTSLNYELIIYNDLCIRLIENARKSVGVPFRLRRRGDCGITGCSKL